jgi:general nucleoside transport system permease protein
MNWRVLSLAAFGFVVVWLLLLAVGVSPSESLFGRDAGHPGLVSGSLGNAAKISGTLRAMTPLLILGLGVFLALRAGLFNIGAEGQFLVGALACTVVVLRLPGLLGTVLGITAGVAAGAMWALPAGLIKAYRGGHEVITTIMLNSVAANLTGAIVAGPLQDKADQSPTTVSIDPSTMLPWLFNGSPSPGSPILQVSSGLLVGVLGCAAIGFWLRKTVAGYELRAVGANPVAASFAGVSAKQVIVRAMAASGAIGGLAGAVQVLAYEGRFYSGFSPGYGFDALGVALLSGTSSLGLIPAALLFGILAKGGTAIQILGVPKGITTIVLGILIVVAATVRVRGRRIAVE